MNDDEWLISLAHRAQSAPSETRVQFIILDDYLEALRYCRVFRLEHETGEPLEDNIRRCLGPRKSRFIAAWKDVPFGLMAFCGIFYYEPDGKVISRSRLFWSLTEEEEVRDWIKAALDCCHQDYRKVTKAAGAFPVPMSGAQTN